MFYPSNDEGINTDAPTRRRVGHELEFQNAQGGAPYEEVTILQMDGVATPQQRPGHRITIEYNGDGTPRTEVPASIHSYRCRCNEQDNYPLHPTVDAGCEWIIGGSSGVLYGSDRYYEAVDILCRYSRLHKFGPFLGSAGGHVHVGAVGSDNFHRVIDAYNHFWDDMLLLTRGDLSRVRDYQNHYNNAEMLIRRKTYGTFEFRQWNGSRVPETIHLSAAVSIGIVEAANDENPPGDFANVLEWIAPYLTPTMQEAVEKRLSPAWRPRNARTGKFVAAA